MGYKSKLKQMKRSGPSIILAIGNNAWEELCTSIDVALEALRESWKSRHCSMDEL